MNKIEKAIEYLKDLKYDFAYYPSGMERCHDDYLNTAISALENNEQLKRDLAAQNEYSERLAERLRATNNLLKKARKKQLSGGWIPVSDGKYIIEVKEGEVVSCQNFEI